MKASDLWKIGNDSKQIVRAKRIYATLQLKQDHISKAISFNSMVPHHAWNWKGTMTHATSFCIIIYLRFNIIIKIIMR